MGRAGVLANQDLLLGVFKRQRAHISVIVYLQLTSQQVVKRSRAILHKVRKLSKSDTFIKRDHGNGMCECSQSIFQATFSEFTASEAI